MFVSLMINNLFFYKNVFTPVTIKYSCEKIGTKKLKNVSILRL